MTDRPHSAARNLGPASRFKVAYRINEACYCLGIGRTALYGLVKSGQLRLIKIAGRSLGTHPVSTAGSALFKRRG